jgi:aminopeptidase N
MRFAFTLPVFFALSTSLATADTYPRQPAIDVEHYTFRIALSDDSDEITGETTVSVRFVKDGVAEFRLDLASPSNGKGMTVTAVASSGEPVPYTHESDRLRIRLDPPPQPGEVRQFTIEYHGIPADGLHIAKNKFGDRTFFSNNWPDLAHQWLPTIDHPYDKATSEFLVTAPARYQVVANGLLVEELDLADGRRTTHWKQSVPICAWLDSIGVAQFSSRHFDTAAGVPLQTWVFPRDREAGIATFEDPTRESIEFYRDQIGPYPYEKLADVEVVGFNGGVENASAIFYGEATVNGRPALGLVSHEIAHQWFGDSVTENDWDDVWLSEGFATYFTLLATERQDGRDAFVAGLKRSRTAISLAEQRLPGVAVVQNKVWTGIPNQIVYQKGAWALHMLRGQIGAEKFWAGIREYYRRYRDRNASTADFEKVMEEISGADLRWFFDQWLYRAGSPVVEGSWRYNSAARKIEIELVQTGPGEVYRLPIEIGISGSTQPQKIEMTRKRQRFEIVADQPPASVEIDPNTWVLMDVHFTGK